MTKKELFAALEHLPDDSIIEVLEECNSGYATYTSWADIKNGDIEILDFRRDSAPGELKGKVFIRLGIN